MRSRGWRLSVFFFVLVVSSGIVTLLAALIGVNLALLAPVYMFTPLIAAFATVYLFDLSVSTLGLTPRLNRWFLVAWGLPVLIAAGSIGVSLLVPEVSFNHSPPGLGMPETVGGIHVSPLVSVSVVGILAGPTLNAVYAVGEEVGWRGFLLYELRGLGFWRASAGIGIVWGLWHTPLILQGYNYPGYPIIGIGMMVVFTALQTPLLVFVRLKANSVFASAVFHGTLNGLGTLTVIAVTGGNNLTASMVGMSGFIVLFGLNIALWQLMRQRDGWNIRMPRVAERGIYRE